ncbi:MAG: hypothetical protein IJL67_00920 [Oscillospiraceae bacterium]|nr:hypothetical protein [Oscillospiraceae bacterium]
MNNSKAMEKSGVSKKLSDVFLTVLDLFCGKYLLLTLLINMAIVTKPVLSAISVTTGMYMYYTAETSAFGNRPNRFFGLFCGLYPDKYLFMTVFKIMYFIELLLLSFAVHLLIRRLSDPGKKMCLMFCLTLSSAMFFKSSDRAVLSLALMFAFSCSLFAVYYLVLAEGKIRYLTLAFALLAVAADVRTVYLCVIIPAIMLVKKYRTEKSFKEISVLMLVASLVVFIFLAVLTNDNKNYDDVKQYFEDYYSEKYDQVDNYTDEDAGTYHMSNANSVLMPESFFKVTAINLVVEWIPNIADTILSFTFEDIFQGLCYIYIPLIAIYNHLTEPEEEKRKSASEEV